MISFVHPKLVIAVLVTALLFWVIFEFALIQYRIKIGEKLAAQAVAYEQTGAAERVLFIGDSSAVGTGASNKFESTAGRLGQDFPDINIENKAVNGAKVQGVLENQLETLNLEKYDLIILQIGGNDIVQGTDYELLSSQMSELLSKVSEISINVIVLTSGDVGGSPIWPTGFGWVMTKRTEKVRDIFISQINKHHNINYVDLLNDPTMAPFDKDPYEYHAADTFHPSSKGYELWYEALLKTIKKLDAL